MCLCVCVSGMEGVRHLFSMCARLVSFYVQHKRSPAVAFNCCRIFPEKLFRSLQKLTVEIKPSVDHRGGGEGDAGSSSTNENETYL